MGKVKIDQNINTFRDKVIKTLNLKYDKDGCVRSINRLVEWAKEQYFQLQTQIQGKKKNQNYFGNWFSRARGKKSISQQNNFKEIQLLKKYIQEQFIPNDFNFIQSRPPAQIVVDLQKIKEKQWIKYYGLIKGPILNGYYLESKEKFNQIIQQVYANDLKFMMVDLTNLYKYQRNLLQQVMSNVLRQQNFLSVVLKIQTTQRYSLYCYIEDKSAIKNQSQQLFQLDKIFQDFNQLYIINENKKKIQISDNDFFKVLLSEILVLPLRTLVPNFAIRVQNDKATILKYSIDNKNLQKDPQKMFSHSQLKQHPSLRSPLFYFRTYLNEHSICIKDIIDKQIPKKQLFSRFYHSLGIIIQFIQNDFTFEYQERKIKVSSLCFNLKVFSALWQNFHKSILLKGWLRQIIGSVKEKVTFAQIIAKYCPIFIQLMINNFQKLQNYKQFYKKLDIQSYLATSVKKKTLQKYKDIFINIEQAFQQKQLRQKDKIYNQIFAPVIEQIDLHYCDPIQCCYILHFVSKNKYLQVGNLNTLPQEWKDHQIWKECIKRMKDQKLTFIDIDFDFLGFSIGINTFEIDENSFERVQFSCETEFDKNRLKEFIYLIKNNFPKQSSFMLTSLLQTAFKHRKYQFCKILLAQNARVQDFSQVLKHQQLLLEDQSIIKENLIQDMKLKSPRMHRLYQWQKMMILDLKQPFQNSIHVQTIDYEDIYIPKKIFGQNQKIINDLSRNDYMYDPNRQITRVNCQNGQSYYIERSNFPILPHFYSTLFKIMGLQDVMPYFTSFYHKNQVYHIIQHLPGAATWKNILSNHSQNQLILMTNPSLISESIILSLGFLPAKITLKDMIVKSSDQCTSDKIFIINWNSFYRRQLFYKRDNDIKLGCKNSLFILDMMDKVISPTIVKKFTLIQDKIKRIFQQITSISNLIDNLKQKNKEKSIPNKQQLGIIFQKNFLFKFAQRLYKGMRVLKKQKSVTHLKLLEAIEPHAASYYQQIINSQATLIKRQQHLFDNIYKKPFLNSCNLIQFFGSFQKIQEQENQYPQHYYKFCFEGPTQNLTALSKQTKKLKAFNSKQLAKNLKNFSPEAFQYYITQVDTSQFQNSQKQLLFNLIRQRSTQYINNQNKNAQPLTKVSFKNLQVIKDKLVNNFSYERTQQVRIEDCKIGDYELANFLKILDNITLLSLKNIKNLKFIGGQNSVFQKTLQIKNLKTLIVQQCDELVGIQIRCDILANVKLKNNKLLQNIYFRSKNLKNLYTSKNINLNFCNLAVYILKGINVYTCKVSCHGQLTKLISQNYQIYILKILKHIFDIFQNASTQISLLTTFSRLYKAELDSVAKNMINITANMPTLLFKGYPKQIQDRILLQLIKIFFQNKNFNTFSVYPFMSTSSQKPQRIFRLMLQSLQEVKNVGSIKQLKIPKVTQNLMQTITKICGLLRFEKNLILELEDIEEEYNDEKIRFLYFLVEKKDIEKISLRINTSILSKKFFNLFAQVNKNNKIKQVFIERSQLKNSQQIRFLCLKELKIKNCRFEDYSFLNLINEIGNLSLIDNKQKGQGSFIQYIQKNKNLVNLQLSEQNHLSSHFDTFCTLLKNLSKLKTLTLNQNNLKTKNLIQFNQIINQTNIQQLVLYQFYNIDQDYQFSNFLKHTKYLKSLNIQFSKQAHLAQFLKALTVNKSIIKLHLKTSFQIGSNILSPLINNHILEVFTSKKFLPMWLRNQIRANGKQKSDVFEVQQHMGHNHILKTNDYFRLGLSLDGGGVRGYLLATQLQYLTSRVGYPIHQIFDCVGGTSIGGILALSATGSLNQKNPVCYPTDMMDIFQIYKGQIFKKTNMTQIRSLFDTKYTIQSFQTLLKNYLKDCKLSDVLPQTSVIVTAVNRLDNKDLIFRSTEALLKRDKDFYMRDVARATSAAPTYFPSAEIKNIPATKKFSLIDGGVGMNNPSKLVIDQIKKISTNLGNQNNYFLLSLGTGRLKSQVIPTSAGIKDLAPIIDSFTISASNFTERDLQQNYKGHFLRVSPTINLSAKEGELDNTDDSVLKIYKQIAQQAARKNFENTVIFGKYRNYNFVQWLRDNTEKKLQI